MSYLAWFESHATKHHTLVQKLLARKMDKEAIIEYFDFENMVHKEKDFCILYSEGKKCHDIASLNCYLCACPNFRFDDKGLQTRENKTQYSSCSIDSKDGTLATYGDALHQDCSQCSVPHHKSYVQKHFDFHWRVIMQKCF